jgi:hypothetical protein
LTACALVVSLSALVYNWDYLVKSHQTLFPLTLSNAPQLSSQAQCNVTECANAMQFVAAVTAAENRTVSALAVSPDCRPSLYTCVTSVFVKARITENVQYDIVLFDENGVNCSDYGHLNKKLDVLQRVRLGGVLIVLNACIPLDTPFAVEGFYLLNNSYNATHLHARVYARHA